jgi:hypothetical protein
MKFKNEIKEASIDLIGKVFTIKPNPNGRSASGHGFPLGTKVKITHAFLQGSGSSHMGGHFHCDLASKKTRAGSRSNTIRTVFPYELEVTELTLKDLNDREAILTEELSDIKSLKNTLEEQKVGSISYRDLRAMSLVRELDSIKDPKKRLEVARRCITV